MLLQDVSDPSIMISFPLLEDADGAVMVAWTTTPWTLPSNLALCVNPKFTYVKVKLSLFQVLGVLFLQRFRSYVKQRLRLFIRQELIDYVVQNFFKVYHCLYQKFTVMISVSFVIFVYLIPLCWRSRIGCTSNKF